MVSFFSLVAVPAIAFASAVNGLSVGEYYRPTGAQLSGYPDATTAYVRSPCPALNTLANHGYLPRDGKNITHAMFSDALVNVYNIAPEVVSLLVNSLADVVSLAELSQHGMIEHDASLVHTDASYAKDPSSLDQILWDDLIGRAKDGQLGVSQLAGARKDREARCKAKSTGCDFGFKPRMVALGEAALLLRGLGGKNEESISVEFATSFLVKEQIPAAYTKPPTPVSMSGTLASALKIQTLAPFV